MAQKARVKLAKRTAPCPACGGRVEFRLSTSLVTVCEYCNSAVARTDRGVETHGKVADLAETASPLALGTQGKWNQKTLRLVGRVQYRHAAGGVWDEWYFALADGKWGWLAEAQGRFYLTFHRAVSAGRAIPAYESLSPGDSLTLGDWGEFTVNEVGVATFHAAEGELPFDPQAAAEHRTADLSGPKGAFATFDYRAGGAEVYLGQEVTLDMLQIRGLERDAAPRTVDGQQLNCPNCGGPFPLHAPDSALRATCPSCKSFFNVDGGKLQYLSTLKTPDPPLVIPLGAVGTLKGGEWTVIGYVRRFVKFDKRYYWSEYLLYHPREGYRWLIHSDGHWSFGWTVAPADVKIHAAAQSAEWNGRTFRLFQSKGLHVSEVYGEFYWAVREGEVVQGRDYVAAPFMITAETSNATSKGTGSQEITITVAEYLPHAELESAFGLKTLQRGWGVAPNQPCAISSSVFGLWGLFVMTILGIWALVSAFKTDGVDFALGTWALILISIMPLMAMIYLWGYEQSRWKDSEFNPYSSSED